MFTYFAHELYKAHEFAHVYKPRSV